MYNTDFADCEGTLQALRDFAIRNIVDMLKKHNTHNLDLEDREDVDAPMMGDNFILYRITIGEYQEDSIHFECSETTEWFDDTASADDLIHIWGFLRDYEEEIFGNN